MYDKLKIVVLTTMDVMAIAMYGCQDKDGNEERKTKDRDEGMTKDKGYMDPL